MHASSNTADGGACQGTFWETVIELAAGRNVVLVDDITRQYPERLIVAMSYNKEEMLGLADEIEEFLGRK